ncbi:methionyl-tRNA formyltransferase [Lentilactobacillus raoultii]|uniref:Methionyl-tRNA formyltransferase n=1 Tax=Lentilactobacillus raoultii TaxID=1987503 RepID=A0ABW3PN69_9LACO|nr:formyltransferase family protein [Lentilactobacillus raoultii]
MKKFKIIFFSEVNSKFGMPFFKRIVKDPHFEIVAFVTTPAGKLCSYYVGEPNPVDLEEFAKSKSIPVFRPTNIKSTDFVAKLKTFSPDYIIIANYQKILRKNLIVLPKYEALNFHPSPLPRYAGLAPFFWMAKNGEHNSGVSCIEVAPEIDGGKIVAQLPVHLTGGETSPEIRNKLFDKSLKLLENVLQSIISGTLSAQPQDKSLRQYFGNPSMNDRSITANSSLHDVLATMRACAPNYAYLFRNDKYIPVTAVGYVLQNGSIPFRCQGVQLFFQPATNQEKVS